MSTGAADRYRAIGALPAAAAYVDADGTILAENDAFRVLHPTRPEPSTAALTLRAVFDADDWERVRRILGADQQRACATACAVSPAASHAAMRAEFTPITRKSQYRRFWLLTLQPGPGLEHARNLAARAEITAGIVHDLRAPVQVVLGWASLLRRQRGDSERVERALMTIERNAELMMSLLEDLLEETRLPGTREPTHPRQVDLVQLARAEVRALQPIADARGVRLSLDTAGDAIAVSGDEIQLRRVLINLLDNALKFTPPAGTVECRVWSSEGWAGIAVRDTGPGIAREFLPRVFQAFVQASDQPARKPAATHGVGLGLAVVRRLVHLHGGTVTASSTGRDGGTTFTVRLPVAGPAGRGVQPGRGASQTRLQSSR